jgi:hypothetical protein
LVQTAELVAGLGATGPAGALADELAGYTGELAAWGAVCWGAFDRYRGMMLGLLGHHDHAVAALHAALALEDSVGSPPLTARTRYWLARALRQRDDDGDAERAAAELARARETAEGLGMSGLALAARQFTSRPG